MYTSFQEAFRCLLFGRYERKHILLNHRAVRYFYLTVSLIGMESVKQFLICLLDNWRPDLQVGLYLAESHYASSSVQHYFNISIGISLGVVTWMAIRIFLLSKYGGQNYAFCEVLFFVQRSELRQQLKMSKEQFSFYRRLARYVYRIGIASRWAFAIFFLLPSLAYLLYKSLLTLSPAYWAVSLCFFCSFAFAIDFAAVLYKNGFSLFMNFTGLQALRVRALSSSCLRLRQRQHQRERQLALGLEHEHEHAHRSLPMPLFSQYRKQFNVIVCDFESSHSLFKILTYYCFTSQMMFTTTLYLGCFTVREPLFKLYISFMAFVILVSIYYTHTHMNMLFMNELEKMDKCWLQFLYSKSLKPTVRQKLKLLVTLSLQQYHGTFSYTFDDYFRLTRATFFRAVLDISTTIMLIYQSQNT